MRERKKRGGGGGGGYCGRVGVCDNGGKGLGNIPKDARDLIPHLQWSRR